MIEMGDYARRVARETGPRRKGSEMYLRMTISGPKGFLAETDRKIRLVSDVEKALLGWLDSLPKEVDGQAVADWDKISIEITN